MSDVPVQKNIPLAPYTTFSIGGNAEYFVIVKNVVELARAVQFAHEHNLPVTILGGGSNVLVADAGVRGLVIKNEITGTMYEENNDEVFVTAGAGVVWDELVAETVAQGLWGIENLSAIPGTVGATPVQNVGAYGVEISDLLVRVKVFDIEIKEYLDLSLTACAFGYRDSIFKHPEGKKYIVSAVTYRLSKTPMPRLDYKDLHALFSGSSRTPSVEEIRNAVIKIRADKFPDWHTVGTAGSFFKNPVVAKNEYEKLSVQYPSMPGFPVTTDTVKISLGWILEHVLHLKGIREDAVGTFEAQALVIVNYGSATASDVDVFAKNIEKKVFDATGIKIEREVRMVS